MTARTSITVSGPGQEPRAVASPGAGVNFAQRLAEASRNGATFYVRDEADRALYRIEREKDGSVSTYALGAS